MYVIHLYINLHYLYNILILEKNTFDYITQLIERVPVSERVKTATREMIICNF